MAGDRAGLLARGIAAALLFGTGACAVPVPPTGGPADTTPPTLVSSEPASGTVRFAGDRVRLRFDEYVDQRSANASVQVTPEPARPPEVRYGGRSIELRFREPLRDSTTYIISLDTGFRDAHGAALKAPIQVAFSTGDVIDSGRLRGLVLDADTGRPAPSVDVFAYLADTPATTDSLPAEPAYRTQTDGEGRFRLEHLAERPFLVVAVRDANRNRTVDPVEAMAAPPVPTLTADSAGTPPDRPWLLSRRDATPPELRRVAARSDSRIEILFSEGIRVVRPAGLRILDSLGSGAIPIRAAGFRPGDPRTLVIRTAPMKAARWTVRGESAVADSAGNFLEFLQREFASVRFPDTSRARFRGFEGDTLGGGTPGIRDLAPWAAAVIRLSDVAAADSVARSVSVADTSGRPVTFDIESVDGSGFRVAAGPSPFDVSIHPPLADSVIRATFEPAPATRLGEFSGIASGGAPVVVELVPPAGSAEPVHRVTADASGRFLFEGLPAGRRYRIRAFVDEDGDGAWTAGSPAPWTAAEPLAWLEQSPPVRARWETALPDTLRIGVPVPGVPSRGE